ncbi:MAG: Gamma carbonic anhydrase family protein [Candidatus Fermentimicrarchaeum limneticum]|uniref:Gamma carbonic anhydrase family protein n=1 Tax=Fermentimicrarchaeum limneticum TaxID=2795018 RepID=A0A7D6BKW2_FERL1|nr:MAG: Gamma carbonic anhydrase family protein [Candidatus Fermentimicrarchaeum limneticum]
MKYIHPKAEIVGDVSIGEGSSVWAFAVIRGDEGGIKIGKNTSIQEHCIIHGEDTEIGDNVTVGHSAVVHGAKIGSNVLIGIGAIILDQVEVGGWVIIGAGAVVPPKMRIKPNSLVLGVPAKVARELNEDDRKLVVSSYEKYVERVVKLGK